MKRISLMSGILLGVLSSLPVIALSLAGAWLAHLPPFPLDFFDWLARALPGPVIAFGIDSMVKVIHLLRLGPTSSTAKLGEQVMGLAFFVIGGAVLGVILTLVGRRRPQRLLQAGLAGGFFLALGMLLVESSLGFKTSFFATFIWLEALFLLWGAALGWLLRGPARVEHIVSGENPSGPSTPTLSRKEFLYLGAASAAAVAISAVSLERLNNVIPPTGGTPPVSDFEAGIISQIQGPINIPPVEALKVRIPPAPGTRPELTANENFYRIDINTIPPTIDASNWRVELTGLVDKPLSLSMDELRSRPSVNQALTMECISNPLGGDLTGTTIWTGIPLKDILAEAGLKPDVKGIYIEAKDGYYEYVFLETAMDPRTLLVYAMNGEPLPEEHGYPVRIYIPNVYGMKQPKWITRMEAVNEERPGYWVERGWDHDAIVKTTSVIDTVAKDNMDPNTKLIPVGGIAWAGDRGISKVELKVDEGEWIAATLRQPPLSALTWIEWRYDWPAQVGKHRLFVRAYDGTGTLQESTLHSPEPHGATGIYTWDTVILDSNP